MTAVARRLYSVAQARAALPRILDEVAGGGSVAITRRGRPVAVLVSVPAYRSMAGQEEGFAASYRTWRASVRANDLILPRDYFRKLRDRSPGREVKG